jgi:hypothetical protein
MLKATELQIGDWVQLPDSAGRVVSIAKNGIYFESELGEGVCSFDHLQSVPITPKILEKNGFKKYGDTGWWLEEDYYDVHVYEWSDGVWVSRYEITEINCPHEQATMSYVHELQQFLRLCGIEKKIEL